MAKIKYNAQHKVVLDALLLGEAQITAGVFFGMPSYKIGGKVFTTLYDDGVGIKLPAARAQTLLGEAHIGPF